jgi:hypothetical protein
MSIAKTKASLFTEVKMRQATQFSAGRKWFFTSFAILILFCHLILMSKGAEPHAAFSAQLIGAAPTAAPGECPAVTVNPAGGSLPSGMINIPYNQAFTATGGTAPYTFSFDSGIIPAGLTLLSTGTLSGTPLQQGVFLFVITATDGNGCQGSHKYKLVIDCNEITISPAALPLGTPGMAYNQTLTASGGCAPYKFTLFAGTLPPGFTLSPGGILSGTPATSGEFTFTISVTDICGCTAEQRYRLTIECAALGRPPYTFRGGNVDEFASPADPASPSAALQAALPTTLGWKNFDDPATDQFFGHTFTNLPANIVEARLEVRIKPGDGIPENDTMALGFAPGNPALPWGIAITDLPANASHNWNPGQPALTFTLDLRNLPPSGTRPTNLIAMLRAKRYLDLAVQDDTTVDYVKLFIRTCPPQQYFFGLPFEPLGQVQIDRDSKGNVVVSNFGSSGEDGVEIGVGNGAGFNAHWLDLGDAPSGAFIESRRRGVVDGVPNQFIGSIRHTKEGESFVVSADYSALGAAAYQLKFLRLGELVESRVVKASGAEERAPLWKTPRWLEDIHIVYCIGCGDSCISPDSICAIAVVTYGGVAVSIGQHAVDTVLIEPVTLNSHSISDESLQLVGSQIHSVTFTDVNISAFGKQHRALGAATLEPFNGNLTVANIGSRGGDGVMVDLNKAESFNFTVDPLDLEDLARPGSFIRASTTGLLNGAPDQPLAALEVTKTGAAYLITSDFSAIGSPTHRIQIYNGDVLVAETPGHRGPVGFASAWPRALGALGGKLESLTADFEPGTTFTIDGKDYRGNQLRVLPENPSSMIHFKSAFTLRAAGINEFTLTGAEVLPAPGR